MWVGRQGKAERERVERALQLSATTFKSWVTMASSRKFLFLSQEAERPKCLSAEPKQQGNKTETLHRSSRVESESIKLLLTQSRDENALASVFVVSSGYTQSP